MKLKFFKENIAKLRKSAFIAGASLSLVGLAASSSCVVDKTSTENEIETDSYGLNDNDLYMLAEVISNGNTRFNDDEEVVKALCTSRFINGNMNLNNNIDVFSRGSVNQYGKFVPSLDDYDVCTKFEIASHTDTQTVLETYNRELKWKKLTVDDLEYMSKDGTFSIKREDGSYTQIGMDYYHIADLYDNAVIVLDLKTDPVLVHDLNTNTASYKVIEKHDILTGKEIDIEDLKNNDFCATKVGDYLMNNNISFDAYTFPIKQVWSSSEKEAIIKKYGMEVWKCVEKYGLPMKMYKAENFYNNSKRMVKH